MNNLPACACGELNVEFSDIWIKNYKRHYGAAIECRNCGRRVEVLRCKTETEARQKIRQKWSSGK